jgi:PhoPQ-activated pathogenicity-related protein
LYRTSWHIPEIPVRAIFLTLALLAVAAAAGAAVYFTRATPEPVPAPPQPPPGPPAPQAPAADEIPSELTDYVNAKDDSFSWKLADTTRSDLGTVYTLDLVSQTWHGVKWDHKLQVFVPKDARPQATMVLWNEGGTPDFTSTLLGLKLAGDLKAPFAILFGVPKQPLYGGKTEDALIAESFVRYLTTQDPSWPLLFPMVKSVVRSMDALQAFASREWKFEVQDFVISGASKRGWTAWLTAATGDKRVKAIAPAVFDTLNIGPQMEHQVRAYGAPSDMIKDYSERLLVPIPRTAPARRLWKIIDPWSYRDRITMPKLIVLGANDEYWTTDALSLYWDGLKGDKWVLYVPNAGHRLVEKDKNGKVQAVPERAFATLSAFARAQVFDKPLPKINCEMVCPVGAECLDVNLICDVKPKSARVYAAKANTRDFRPAFWEAQSIQCDEKSATCKVDFPKMGHRATLVELTFTQDGQDYTLSTPVRVIDAPKK